MSPLLVAFICWFCFGVGQHTRVLTAIPSVPRGGLGLGINLLSEGLCLRYLPTCKGLPSYPSHLFTL